MRQFDANMRSVRSFICDENDRRYFTTDKNEQLGRVLDTICNHCGRRLDGSCVVWDFIAHAEENSGACLKVHGCQHYEPVLTFKEPLEGFYGSFTTFRVGSAWASRVFKGQVVSLYNMDAKSVFAYGFVEWVELGPLSEMLERFAHLNHSQKDNPDIAGAPARMMSRLKKLYGPKVVDAERNATVIGLCEISKERADQLRSKIADRRRA